MLQSWRKPAVVTANLGLLGCLVLVAGCPWCFPWVTPTETTVSASEVFPNSLHATRPGKETWYKTANGGFEAFTNVPMGDLGCIRCHTSNVRPDGSTVDPATYVPTCNDCHIVPGVGTVAQETCLGCHSRQGQALAFTDVHREMGFTCMSCHTVREMHGDGTAYTSFLEEGATDASCDMEGCHTELVPNAYHDLHSQTVYCSACHTQTVVTCYNCHFESTLQGGGKRFYAPPMTGFQFLVRRQSDGKVTTGTMQALTYAGNSFYAIGPFHGHTTIKNAKTCDDCHGNNAVTEYVNTGQVTITEWDAGTSSLTGPQGVIPVPPDWPTAFQLDFVDYFGDASSTVTDPDAWDYLKTGADGTQMLFAEPLTDAQMQKLR